MSLLRPFYRAALTAANASSYYLFHRKFRAEKDQVGHWENRHEADYARNRELENDPYYRLLDSRVLERLRAFDSRTYLEVGCYFGFRLNKFAAALPERSFIGLDFGLKNIQFAKEKVVRSPNARLIHGDATAMPFADRSMETIYTVVCLTHIPYDKINKAISEMARVAAKTLLLVEVDLRPMNLKNKINCLNWEQGYMHAYDKLLKDKMKLKSVLPLQDAAGHPRYTFFEFSAHES